MQCCAQIDAISTYALAGKIYFAFKSHCIDFILIRSIFLFLCSTCMHPWKSCIYFSYSSRNLLKLLTLKGTTAGIIQFATNCSNGKWEGLLIILCIVDPAVARPSEWAALGQRRRNTPQSAPRPLHCFAMPPCQLYFEAIQGEREGRWAEHPGLCET